MTAKNKIKGNNFEREVVKKFTDAGFKAKRAYASDGRSLGHHAEVDLLVTKGPGDDTKLDFCMLIQCKRKKTIPKYLGLTDNVDAVVFREDRGETYIMHKLDIFLNLII